MDSLRMNNKLTDDALLISNEARIKKINDKDVIDAIENDREPYVNGEAGRRALEMVLAIYKSAATGESVEFPLKDCSTMDFVGRFDA